VMDTLALRRKYQGRLAFHGGMSIQHTLPFGTVKEVRDETRRLLRELGRGGGYVFAPAHAMPADVPVENVLAFMEVLLDQPGCAGMRP
jgi:uroporphyrinogen decarboxylase